ncbi:MAG: hypothetical protein ACQESP_00035 [Candidatus Muiribacteriota bacterium]
MRNSKRNFIFLILLFCIFSPMGNILVVADGAYPNDVKYYTDRLSQFEYEVMDSENVDIDLLNNYKAVFWICGDAFTTLKNEQKDMLKQYITTDNQTGLFIEGERLMYDAAWIDYKFFFRNFFKSDFGGHKTGNVNFSTHWSNVITWGIRDDFYVNLAGRDLDFIDYRGMSDNEVLFEIKEPNQRGSSSKVEAAGVAIDNYKNRVALLSFSPASRSFWEIDSSDFVRNLAEWLVYDIRNVMSEYNKIASRRTEEDYDEAQRYTEMAFQRIVAGFENNNYQEFDYLKKAVENHQVSKELSEKIFMRLKEKYTSLEEWQQNFSIKTRIEFMK